MSYQRVKCFQVLLHSLMYNILVYYISTGVGAALELSEGKVLPGVAALTDV